MRAEGMYPVHQLRGGRIEDQAQHHQVRPYHPLDFRGLFDPETGRWMELIPATILKVSSYLELQLPKSKKPTAPKSFFNTKFEQNFL